MYAFLGISPQHEDLTNTEILVLENRLTDQLVNLGEGAGISVTIPRNRSELLRSITEGERSADLATQVSAYAVIAGELNVSRSRFELRVRVLLLPDQEEIAEYSVRNESFDDLVQAGREAIAQLLQEPAQRADRPLRQPAELPEAPELAATPAPSLNEIAGTWQGDEGIELVRITSEGIGEAKLAGSGTMQIRIEIENGLVTVHQDEPNAPKMYIDSFPYTVALQIADVARPMRWRFNLTDDGSMLTGVKDTTLLRIDRGEVTWADTSYRREASWERVD